jgi:hypothetical protein
MATVNQSMSEDTHTRKPCKVSLHPQKFEDAHRGVLKTKPEKDRAREKAERRGATSHSAELE